MMWVPSCYRWTASSKPRRQRGLLFVTWHSASSCTSVSMDSSARGHRGLACLAEEQEGVRDASSARRRIGGMRKVCKSSFPRGQSGDAWLVKKYVDLEDYRRMLASGEVTRLLRLTDEERIRRVGSLIVPIFVPLARGETQLQYEERFKRWLRNTKRISLEKLQDRASPHEERSYWIRFSYVAVKSEAQRAPGRNGRISELQKLTKAVAPQAKLCCGSDVLADALACGCDVCLTTGMQQLARRIGGLETEKKKDDEAHRLDVSRDPVELRLLEEYDQLNAEIELNEAVLAASSADLARTPVHDIKKTVELQDENEELRSLLPEERRRRSKALARVVLYVWRHDINDLKTALYHKNAMNSLYIQRKCHQKATHLAVALAEKQRQGEMLRSGTDQTEGLLRSLAREIQEFETQRRHQFQILLHVDQQLRETILTLIQYELEGG